jgi:serine/threonine protein kinase
VSVLKRTCLRSGLLPAGCFLEGEYHFPDPEPVSRSAFSDVFRAYGYGKDVAVKILRVHADERDRVWKVSMGGPKKHVGLTDELQAYLSEVIVWTCLRHPNIVPFVGVPNTGDFTRDVILVSEWMGEGTITSYLRQRPDEHRGKFVRTDFLGRGPHLM